MRATLTGLFDAWANGDAIRAGAFFALDGRYRERGRAVIDGREAIVAHFTAFFRDGPRWRFEAEDILVEGERAAVRYRFAILGDDGGREVEGCAWVTFANGTIAEWREYEG